MKFLKILLLCSFCSIFFPLNGEEISVMACNLWNYFLPGDRQTPLKSESSRELVAKIVKNANPNIFIAIEVGGEKSLAALASSLKSHGCEYPHVNVIEGEDNSRHIVLFSKTVPTEFSPRTDMTYKIKVKDTDIRKDVRVQRGFTHAVFTFESGYRLHVIGAHLKAKVFHPRYNQTDMRRYEARLLRYFVNEILEKEPDANILLMGDLNDTFDSDPIRFIRDDKREDRLRLYDLKPADKWGFFWTHWFDDNDIYSRIDYAFASWALLPEIIPEKTYIPHDKSWFIASDHRPLLITIKTENLPPPSQTAITARYPRLKDPDKTGEEKENTEE
jgi:endonuclease/exonuclease/phosphatase family metal-dependent hydrolase